MKSSGSPSPESGLSDLKPDSPADAPKSGSASKEEVFMPYRSGRTIGRVRFRTEPSTDAKSMLTFEKGVTLTVLSRCGDWYKVMYKGDTGYVYARYLKLK